VARGAASRSRKRTYILEVAGGEDDKARIEVGSEVRSIGRAREADLRLHHRAVSRHHVDALAGESGIELVLCGDETRLLTIGRRMRSS
jgi:hypothetical protein